MQICYFGSYNRGYSRNSIFLKGLKLNGVDVKEINFSTNLRNYPISYFKTVKLQFDAMIIGYSYNRRYEIFLARLSMKKPILFDALLSQYDTQVFDRKIIEKNSLRAKYLYYRELFTLKLADCIILDTNAHINYFKELFPLKYAKYERIFIGSDDSIAFPSKIRKKSNKFCVVFVGSYIPLHGIEFILEAAKELLKDKEIIFRLIGGGQMFEHIKKLKKTLKLSNIELIPLVPYPKAIEYMNSSDVCLGIFGITRKANNVIPNKVFDALATAKPLITGDSIAIREILKHKKNCILCKRGDSKSLAEAIKLLKDDQYLKKKIAQNGYNLYKKCFTPKHIGRSILKILYKFI